MKIELIHAIISTIPPLVSLFPIIKLRNLIFEKNIEKIFFDISVNNNDSHISQLRRKHFRAWHLILFRYNEKDISARLWALYHTNDTINKYLRNQANNFTTVDSKIHKAKSNKITVFMEFLTLAIKMYAFLLSFTLLSWLILSISSGFNFEDFLLFLVTPAILPAIILLIGTMSALIFNQDDNFISNN